MFDGQKDDLLHIQSLYAWHFIQTTWQKSN